MNIINIMNIEHANWINADQIVMLVNSKAGLPV